MGNASVSRLPEGVTEKGWRHELERTSFGYHMRVLWVATVFDPIFAITDYFNIPSDWQVLLGIRLFVSFVTLVMFAVRNKYGFPSRVNVAITFLLISFQNAYIYMLIEPGDLLGQNLNYMALFVGASMFIHWEWKYSVIIVLVSALATAYFISLNPAISPDAFIVNGGLLLGAVSIFMIVLIHTRQDLFIKEIKSRLELNASKEILRHQAEEIKTINENLEKLVLDRTLELEKKNKALEDYAFISAHQLRAPVASILGLIPILQSLHLDHEGNEVLGHLDSATRRLDTIVHSMTEALEDGEAATGNHTPPSENHRPEEFERDRRDAS